MAELDHGFEWYDAWVLAALIYASDGTAPVPLWRLIHVADALNKSIVSRDELEIALGRLARAGYVRAAPDGFEPTPAALALKVPGPPLDTVTAAIGAKPAGKGIPKTTRERYVSSAAYEEALRTYREYWKERGETGPARPGARRNWGVGLVVVGVLAILFFVKLASGEPTWALALLAAIFGVLELLRLRARRAARRASAVGVPADTKQKS